MENTVNTDINIAFDIDKCYNISYGFFKNIGFFIKN